MKLIQKVRYTHYTLTPFAPLRAGLALSQRERGRLLSPLAGESESEGELDTWPRVRKLAIQESRPRRVGYISRYLVYIIGSPALY